MVKTNSYNATQIKSHRDNLNENMQRLMMRDKFYFKASFLPSLGVSRKILLPRLAIEPLRSTVVKCQHTKSLLFSSKLCNFCVDNCSSNVKETCFGTPPLESKSKLEEKSKAK